VVIVDEISRTTMRPRVGWINYNPSTGTFISEDPILFHKNEFNSYQAVNNNPLTYLDPSGEGPVTGGFAFALCLGITEFINDLGTVEAIGKLQDQVEEKRRLLERYRARKREINKFFKNTCRRELDQYERDLEREIIDLSKQVQDIVFDSYKTTARNVAGCLLLGGVVGVVTPL
jgi:hypothetical protein